MERRRRAFGLKNLENKKETQIQAASTSNYAGSPTSSLKSAKTGARSSKQCTVPEQCTPKRKEPSESPRSPLVSPGLQPVFPRTLNSPEIEVSWDWDCSQVANDMLPPPKRPKRKCQLQISPLVEPVATTYSRLTQSQETTTKENEERLAFYKNILSKSFQQKSELVAVVENNNVEVNRPEVCTTPHRPRMCSKNLNKSIELVNDPFDDSANEFMFECSQAIEEKLKTGEIQVGTLVKIDLGNRGIATSSQQPQKNTSQEKTKQNQFSNKSSVDSQKRCQVNGLKSPVNKRHQVDSNLVSGYCQKVKLAGSNKSSYLTNNVPETVSTPKTINNKNVCHTDKNLKTDSIACVKTPSGCFRTSNCVNTKANAPDRLCGKSSSISTNSEKRPHQTMSRESNRSDIIVPKHNNDSVDKFRRPIQGSSVKPNVPNSGNSNVASRTASSSLQVNSSSLRPVQEGLSNWRTSHDTRKEAGARSEETPSITSLLDDDFDMELSCLDFDSLVRTEAQPAIKKPPETNSSGKCSKQEIEAKRLAALNRLKMKKKR